MKRSLISMNLIVLFTMFCANAFAQEGYFVAKDYRIARFEKDMILYLVKEKQIMDVKTPFNIQDYKHQIVAWKCLELYSDTTSKNMLLVGFSTSTDHGDRFWGVLFDNEKYFFYNLKDPEYLRFQKKYSADKVAIVNLYYQQHISRERAIN